MDFSKNVLYWAAFLDILYFDSVWKEKYYDTVRKVFRHGTFPPYPGGPNKKGI